MTAILIEQPKPQTFEFMVLLHKPSTEEERCEAIVSPSDRFRDVLAIVRNRFPGWYLCEAWEPDFSEHDAPF